MTDVKQLLIDTLKEAFGLPVILQGTLATGDEYPSYFTYWNNDTAYAGFYDNEETRTDWDLDLNFYSTDPTEVNTKLLEAVSVLKDAGFTVPGVGYDVASDEVTHTGRGINIIFIDKKGD